MDMGIVNAGQLAVYNQLDSVLKNAIEDVLFDRDEHNRESSRGCEDPASRDST